MDAVEQQLLVKGHMLGVEAKAAERKKMCIVYVQYITLLVGI